MSKLNKLGFFAPLFFALFVNNLFASFVIGNSSYLPEKTIEKIEQMGTELHKKSGVFVYLAIIEDLNGSTIAEIENKISYSLKKPFILLSIAINDKKIDIINSKELNNRFNKEQILSPWPWSGSILPLLTAKTKDFKANVEAALLNGYADIVEQVAKSYGVELESAIGSQNRVVFFFLKIIFYGIILLIIIKIIYGRFKKNEK